MSETHAPGGVRSEKEPFVVSASPRGEDGMRCLIAMVIGLSG